MLGLGILGLFAVFAGFTPLFERVFGRTRLRFPYQSRPIAEATYAALAAKPGWAKTALDLGEGIRLNGLIRRPSSKTASWVLFYPGNDESQLERGQTFLSQMAGSTELGLAVFAYRGFDSSSGKSTLAGIRADAPDILARLCATEGVPAGRVHLVGFSIGGHFAAVTAGRAAERGQRAATLTLLAPVNDIVMVEPSRWEKLSSGDDYQTQPLLGAVPAPVLVVQGSADSALGGPQQGQSVAHALGDRARYEELPGVDHVPLLWNERTQELVREFILGH
ncbi:MAG TPA: hypothetical protein VGQ57_01905 [Polyangiaceae bacterium]|nr:hypothetical protein [Polyangiaceae bacterium]